MERIQLKCQNCEIELSVPSTSAGKNGKCPKCGKIIKIPIISKKISLSRNWKIGGIIALSLLVIIVLGINLIGGKATQEDQSMSTMEEATDAFAEVNEQMEQEDKAKTQREEGICFPSFGIAIQTPNGWKIISAKNIATDIFIGSYQKHADQYVKKNPATSCFIQKQVPGDVKPTICVIPGDDYIKNTPESGNLRGGTSTVAGTLASQLAWLASFKGSPATVSSDVTMSFMDVAGQQQFVTKIKGDKVTLIGIGIAKRWQGLPVTIGLAAPPDSLEETKGVFEEIVRQIDKGMKEAKSQNKTGIKEESEPRFGSKSWWVYGANVEEMGTGYMFALGIASRNNSYIESLETEKWEIKPGPRCHQDSALVITFASFVNSHKDECSYPHRTIKVAVVPKEGGIQSALESAIRVKGESTWVKLSDILEVGEDGRSYKVK